QVNERRSVAGSWRTCQLRAAPVVSRGRRNTGLQSIRGILKPRFFVAVDSNAERFVGNLHRAAAKPARSKGSVPNRSYLTQFPALPRHHAKDSSFRDRRHLPLGIFFSFGL